MYSSQKGNKLVEEGSGLINPASFNSSALLTAKRGAQDTRGMKRSSSPETHRGISAGEVWGDDGDSEPRKRGRPMKSRAALGPEPPKQRSTPPPELLQGPQAQNVALPTQLTKIDPTKVVVKALPTVGDHTTVQLCPAGDEYIPGEYDEAGEKKVTSTGHLINSRIYRCRTFYLPNRGDKLFMLATECARVLGYRDSHLLFDKNRSLYKIIATQPEKEDLIHQEIIPFSYRSRQIAIITAKSMFRQFGSRMIVNGRRVKDDYWETKAKEQGFPEEDLAGEKTPGAAKARYTAATEAGVSPRLNLGAYGDIGYNNEPGHFAVHPQQQAVQLGILSALGDATTQTQADPSAELLVQAHQAAEFNMQVNSQRNRSHEYVDRHWRQPEQKAHKLASTHGMEEIREVVLQHLTSSPVPGLDNKLNLQMEAGAMGPEDPSLTESQRFKAMFSVKWELRQFMKEQFGDVWARPMGSVIALTGSALCAQATTVQEYLRRHWSYTGPLLLEILEKALALGISTLSQGDLAIKFLGWTTQQNLLVTGSKDTIVEIAQQLAWLGSVLRTSPSGHVSRSQCRISPRGLMSDHVAFSIEFIVTPLEHHEKSCWHELFFNPVIAYNFPIDPRDFGWRGLEIPIHMMAALGGASMAVEFNGGIVLKGLSSMFVPLQRNGSSIQWHYIRNEDESRMPYSEVGDRCPGRALVECVGFDSLTTTRAFLGWWGHTTSHLGTADANYHNLDWSSTRDPERSIVFRGGSLGFQNIGSGEVNFSPGPKDGKLHISRNGPYQNIVKYASQTPVLLYDTVERRGWLVPASAVIAHIAQMRHFRKPFSINGKLVELVPTDSAMNVYEGAEKMLLENFSTKLSCEKLGTEDFSFRDLVLNIWSLLEILAEKDIKMESTREPSVTVNWKPKLRGWEFMDVVVEKSPMHLKETCIQKSHGGWLDFVRDLNALVFFASGFEDIIQPAQDDIAGLCHKWQRVPKNKDYLTASVSILNNLYEEAGSRLTKKHLTSTHLQWHRGPSLFETCPNRTGYDCSCDRLQQISHEDFLTSGKINPPGLLKERGAAIFGQNQHSSNLKILNRPQTKPDYIYSQVNGPLLQSEYLPKGSVLSSETSGDENYFHSSSEAWMATRTSEQDLKLANGYFESEPNSLEQDKDGARKRSREDLECLPEARRRVQQKGFQALPKLVRRKRRPFNHQLCQQTGPDNEVSLSDSEIAVEIVPKKLRRKHNTDLPRNAPISQSNGSGQEVLLKLDMEHEACGSASTVPVTSRPINRRID